jgi:uncharacterized protein
LTPAGKPLQALDADSLTRMFAVADQWLAENAGALNAINVFPVPDGDTGTNMSATLAAASVAGASADRDVPSVLSSAATGALLGARGNSGVILSQIIAGFAEGVGTSDIDPTVLARGLQSANDAARRAVTEPREGTILTVLSDAAAAADRTALKGCSIAETIRAAATAAHESVQRTPELLPVLREAGVVDSGGLGFALILDAFAAALTGDKLSAAAQPNPDFGAERLIAAGSHNEEDLGYCTEFMVEGGAVTQQELLRSMQRLGTSVLVVGQSGRLRVHLHTPDPGAALSHAVRLGALSRVKVDNLAQQRESLIATVKPVRMSPVVAVASGEGFEALLTGYGAIVVRGGQSQNPSTEELISAIDRAPGKTVFLLPDNRNIVATAEQAARITARTVRVIPTISIPQGISALLSFNPDCGENDNVLAMTGAAASVRTGEVTRSARDVAINGVHAAKGQPIGIIDDVMVVASDSPDAAVLAVCKLMLESGRCDIATLYYGQDVDPAMAETCAHSLQERHEDLEVQVVYGGQPHYDYVLSLE